MTDEIDSPISSSGAKSPDTPRAETESSRPTFEIALSVYTWEMTDQNERARLMAQLESGLVAKLAGIADVSRSLVWRAKLVVTATDFDPHVRRSPGPARG